MPVKVKYAKDAIAERITAAIMRIPNPKVVGEERVELSEHCAICGSPKLRRVVLVKGGDGTVYRCSSKCANILTQGVDQ